MKVFMASTGENIHWLQIVGEVVEEMFAVTACFDFYDDSPRILPDLLRVAVGLVPRCDDFRLWE